MGETNAHDRDTHILMIAVLVLTLACMLCTLTAGAAQALTPHPTTASNSLIAMCAWSRHGSVGLWWNVNYAPARVFERSGRYNAVCALVPWSPVLPERGRPYVGMTP